MTVDKTFGFAGASPYTTGTFNNYSRQVFRRNGLVDPPTAILEDWANRKITFVNGFRFLQQGMFVAKTEVDIVVEVPLTLEAPFYLIGTTADNIVRDNIVFTFAKSPLEIGDSHVILATYDGTEWRYPPLITVDGLIKGREYANRTYGHTGFNKGFGLSHDPAHRSYTLGEGDLTDKMGFLQPLYSSRNIPAVAPDVDYPRIDLLMYRRPMDHYQRSGVFQVVAGPSMVSNASLRTPVKRQNLSTADVSVANVKVLQGPDNSVYVAWCEGVDSDSGVIYFTVMDDTRTVTLLEPTIVASGVSLGMFDMATDVDGYVGFFLIKNMTNLMGGNLLFARLNPKTGIVVTPSLPVEGVDTPYSAPQVVCDRLGYYHVFCYGYNGSLRSISYVKTNNEGAIATPIKDVIPGVEVGSFSIAIDPEFHVHMAYSRVSDGYVHYAEYSEIGESLKDLVVGAGVNPQMYVTDNKELYISYGRSGRLYTWRYQASLLSPTLREYSNGVSRREPYDLEGVLYHRGYVDPLNNLHIIFIDATGLHECAIGPTINEGRAAPTLLDAGWAGFDPNRLVGIGAFDLPLCAIHYDTKGSLFLAYANLSSSWISLGAAISAAFIGQGVYGLETAGIAACELAIRSANYDAQFAGGKPAPGSKIVVSSSGSNDGAYYIRTWRTVTIDGVDYKVLALMDASGTNVTLSPEHTTSAMAQFHRLNGGRVTACKLAPVTTYDFPDAFSRELESDMIYALIKKPSNEIMLWNSTVRVKASGFLRHDSTFITCAGVIKLDSGRLTWLAPIILKDPMQYQLTVPAGNVALTNNDVLFAYLPAQTQFAGDGDAAGLLGEHKTTLADTIGLSPGMTVFVGDSDSPGITCTITSISDKTITTDVSLVEYKTDRGAYVSPVSGEFYKETRNTGVLRPASDGTINQRIFVIAYMADDLVFFRNGALTLSDQEEGHIGEGPTEDLLNYVGATSEVDNDPNYSWNYGGTQGENLTSRLGAVDLRAYEAAQDRNIWDLRATTLDFDFDAMSEKISWSGAEWYVMVPNVGSIVPHTVATAEKAFTILEGEVAYVTVSRTGGVGDLPVSVCAAGSLPLSSDERAHVVIARRKGTSVMLGRMGQVTIDTTATSLTQQQEKTFKLVGGGTWEWTGTTLTWSADAFIEVAGLSNECNRIAAASSAALAADGDILYADIVRKGTTPTRLVVESGQISTTPKGPHRIIFARRVGTSVYVGNMQLQAGVKSVLERPYSEQTQTFIGQPTAATTTHNYSAPVYLQNWMSHEQALAELDHRIAQYFSAFPMMSPFRYYVWEATAGQTSFTVGTGGRGDSTLSWSTLSTAPDIIVLREGLKLQQSKDGVWPIVNTRWNYSKNGAATLQIAEPLAAGEKLMVIYCNTVYPPTEYVWVGNGIATDFDLNTAIEGPSVIGTFHPSNLIADIMVWSEQYRHYCSQDSTYPIPDDLHHHDFYKLNASTIRFQVPPRNGELVVLRLGLPFESMWSDSHWYGDGATSTFTVGVNAYGNGAIRFSNDVTVNDIDVSIDGIILEPNIDYIKISNQDLQFAEAPAIGSKITLHGLDVHVITNPLNILDNGVLVTSEATELDFRGTSVTVLRPSYGKARIIISAAGGATYTRISGESITIPQGRAVTYNAAGRLVFADSTIPGRKNPIGISLEDIEPDAIGAYQVGGIVTALLTGLGFTWSDEVFLGQSGQLVNMAGIPNTGSPTDGIIKVGDVGGSGDEPTDLIWQKQDLGGW